MINLLNEAFSHPMCKASLSVDKMWRRCQGLKKQFSEQKALHVSYSLTCSKMCEFDIGLSRRHNRRYSSRKKICKQYGIVIILIGH